ncbi:MAG: Spore coat protein CotH [Verrucomicrobiales bacterium]|nr:Spore coat protein CotH [Verrucomicrobiales bacterium]
MSFKSLPDRIFLALGFFAAAALSTAAQTTVKINEVFANNQTVAVGGSINDWVELYNTSASPAALGGASLSDSVSNPTKWVFPAGVTISGNGFLLVSLDGGRAASTSSGGILNTGFSLKSEGDTLFFNAPGGNGLDSVTFGLQISTHSIGRIPDGIGTWVLTEPTVSTPNQAASLGAFSELHVNEWMPAPAKGEDWFEVYNADAKPVALTGLYLTDDLTVPIKYPIPALSFIGTGVDAYIRFWADNQPTNGANHTNFKLNNTAETISIFGPRNFKIDSISYDSPVADTPYGRLPDGSTRIVSLPKPGTPGEPNFVTLTSLVVNEVLTHTDPPLEDAVEFYNITDTSVPVGGWYLSNKRGDLKRYQIPSGAVVPAHGYFVVYESQFNGPAAASPFTFNSAHGDEVYLSEADTSGNLTGFRVSEIFEAAENATSIGRFGTSVPGDYKFVELSRLTFGSDNLPFGAGTGASNAYPKIGPIVISEIMFHPPPIGGTTNDNTLHEYVEIQNITATNVPLFDPVYPTNHWRLQNGLDFSFPDNSSIAAFSFGLVVSFDPLNKAALTSFQQRYPNLPQNVPLFGPWNGKLDNNGDPVELYKPDPVQLPPHPDAGFVPFIRVDKVNYLPNAPWPATADGSGASLTRKNPFLFGNDPVNWMVTNPTPGSGPSAENLDRDRDGMPDYWELAYGLNPDDPTDAALDNDLDGFTNVQEYTAGTDPLHAAGDFRIDGITVFQGAATPLAIRFTAIAHKSYTIQFRTDLNQGNWQKLSDVAAQETTASAVVLDPDAYNQTARYYRIVTPAMN